MTQNLEHILKYQIACMRDPACRDKIRRNLTAAYRIPREIDHLITAISINNIYDSNHRRNSQHSRRT